MDIEWSCRSGYMIILLMKGHGPRPREKQEISLTTKRMLMAMFLIVASRHMQQLNEVLSVRPSTTSLHIILIHSSRTSTHQQNDHIHRNGTGLRVKI